MLIFFCGCVSPNAVKMELATVKDNLNKLEQIMDSKADTTVVAKTIESFKQEINQNLLNISKTMNNSGSIKYGGGGWIVAGTGLMALIFLGSGLLLIRAFMKRGNMLSLLTRAVKNSGKDTVIAVKQNLKRCVYEGYHCDQDRKNLGDFAKKKRTFVEQKPPLEV